jgi:hypothetical protein
MTLPSAQQQHASSRRAFVRDDAAGGTMRKIAVSLAAAALAVGSPAAAQQAYPPAAQPTYPSAAQPTYPSAAQPTYPSAAQPTYPSAAQPTYPSAPPDSSAPPERFKAARLLFGAAGVTNGLYCSYGYQLANCSSLYQYKQVPLFFGGEIEVGGRLLGVAVGLYDLNGPYLDVNRNFLEPAADLVLRLGTYSRGPILRFRIGAGLYIGEGGNTGWVGRSGFGISFRGTSPVGFAADFTWEGGGFQGNSISIVRLGIGPEIAF